MSRQVIRSAEFTADRVWGALDIANMSGTTVPCIGRISLTMAR